MAVIGSEGAGADHPVPLKTSVSPEVVPATQNVAEAQDTDTLPGARKVGFDHEPALRVRMFPKLSPAIQNPVVGQVRDFTAPWNGSMIDGGAHPVEVDAPAVAESMGIKSAAVPTTRTTTRAVIRALVNARRRARTSTAGLHTDIQSRSRCQNLPGPFLERVTIPSLL